MPAPWQQRKPLHFVLTVRRLRCLLCLQGEVMEQQFGEQESAFHTMDL